MRHLILGFVAALTAVLATGAAAAADEIINIPIDTVITRQGTREGDVRVLARANVSPDLVGATCTVESEADNQSSVHPNNDVIVSSGNDQVVLPGVEDEPGQISIATGTLTLGTEITAAVRIGPDRQFSGGIIVQLDCDTAEPTTTVATTAPEVTVADTTPDPEVTVGNTTPADPTETTVPTDETEPPAQTTASTLPEVTDPPQQTTASTSPDSGDDPQELPRTGGSTTTTLTVVALAMLGGGGALVLVTRGSGSTERSWVD